jgi:hypothetical protein
MIQKIAGIVKDVVGYDPINIYNIYVYFIYNIYKSQFLTKIKLIRWINNILTGVESLVSFVLNTDPQILKVKDKKTHE